MVCRFAFIEFNSEEEAAAAIEEHNDEEVDGRELHVSPASVGGKQTPQKSSSLYSSCRPFTFCKLCLRKKHATASSTIT